VRLQCRRLRSLVRVADFMLRDALYECVELSLLVLRGALQRIQAENSQQLSTATALAAPDSSSAQV